MARNRVIYQSEAVFVNENAALSGSYNQIERVQSANYSYTINRQDINQFGQLGKLDSIIIDAPTVSADLSYYLTDGFTERALGFFVSNSGVTGGPTDSHVTSGSFISGHIADGSGRNLIITTSPEGTDADLPVRSLTGSYQVIPTRTTTIGLGNCYLSDYSLDLSVGAIPTVSVSFEALNINSQEVITGLETGWAINSPAIDPVDGTTGVGSLAGYQALPDAVTGYTGLAGSDGDYAIAALRPGDITVNIGSFSGSGITDIGGAGGGTTPDSAHIQSASLSIPLSRSPLERLGSNSAYARSVDFPVVSTLSVSAILNEVESFNLTTALQDENEKDIEVTLKNSNGLAAMRYTLKGCSFDSESFTSSIGANKSVDMTFTTSVGGPTDTSHGIFVSGISTGALYTGATYAFEPE